LYKQEEEEKEEEEAAEAAAYLLNIYITAFFHLGMRI
jgi:hypothetical protein